MTFLKTGMADIREKLNAANIPTVWLTENLDSRHRMAEKALKITTIHGCKGLQFRAVLLIFAGECPDLTGGGTEDEERRLFYVALTRAEDYLAITRSRDASFIADIKASGKARCV